MSSKENQYWSFLTEKNIEACRKMVNQYDFEQLKLPTDVQDFVLNISASHHCDPKVLFYTVLSGIGHFCETMNVYNLETKQVKPITVYEIIIAPSGVEKSKYINIISNACTKVEYYQYESSRKKSNESHSIDSTVTTDLIEKKKNKSKDFESWTNQFGAIKQVYTTASLLQMMATSSLFFLANEGDAILQECSFFNPSDVTADVKQGTLIDCWDGNKIVKSTVSHGSKEIKNRTVSMCVATTGRRWPDLLRELSKVQIAGGLHERCTFFCFDVNRENDLIQMTPLAEEQYFSTLYDDLLSSRSTANQQKYSLAQVFFIVKLFGYRVLIWSKESFSFMQPRLNELKTNKPCKLVDDSTLFKTKQQMAVRRRTAEHTVRYACLIQMLINALSVLKSMDDEVIRGSAGAIDENFETEAKIRLTMSFGEFLECQMAFHQNGVPIQPLEIKIEAVESSVALVFGLLLPQAVVLFDYEPSNQTNSVEEQNTVDTKKMLTQAEQTIRQIEKFIIELNYKFFYKSCITDHHFRRHRPLVDNVLKDLVERRFLYEGHGETSFFDIKRTTMTKTFLKFIPTAHDKQRFSDGLLRFFNIEYENYETIFKQSPSLPPNCELSVYGKNFICQSHYRMIITEHTLYSNEIDDQDISLSHQPPVTFSADEDVGDYNERSTLDFATTNHHALIVESLSVIPSQKKNNQCITMSRNQSINFPNSFENRPLSPEDIVLLSQTEHRSEIAVCIGPDMISSTCDGFNQSQHRITLQDEDEREKIDLTVDDIDELSPRKLVSMENTDDRSSLKEIDLPHTDTETGLLSSSSVGSSKTLLKSNEISKSMANSELQGQILLIPSILLTKMLIVAHLKLPSIEIKRALDSLSKKQLLTADRYLQCGKRKIQAYLKYVPENIDNRVDIYLLQRRLLDLDIDVHTYIDSLKTIKFATTSLHASKLLLMMFEKEQYSQLNIDLTLKRKYGEQEQHQQSDTNENTPNDANRRKKRKAVKEHYLD